MVDIEARIDKLEKGIAKANAVHRRGSTDMENRARQSAKRMEDAYSTSATRIGATFEKMFAGFPFGASFPTLEWLTTGRIYGIPHSLIAFAIVTIIMGTLLHKSVLGRYFFAVGKNEEAARYSGINTSGVVIASYVLCSALTAVAAIFIAMYTRSISPSSHGNFYELYAIAAAVLGGCSLRGGEGSIVGVVLGTVLLQVLQNLVNLLGIPSSLNFAVMGSVILIGVIADQQVSKARMRAPKAV